MTGNGETVSPVRIQLHVRATRPMIHFFSRVANELKKHLFNLVRVNRSGIRGPCALFVCRLFSNQNHFSIWCANREHS